MSERQRVDDLSFVRMALGFESPPSPSLGVGWRDIMLDIIGVYVTILEVRDATREEKYETEKQF